MPPKLDDDWMTFNMNSTICYSPSPALHNSFSGTSATVCYSPSPALHNSFSGTSATVCVQDERISNKVDCCGFIQSAAKLKPCIDGCSGGVFWSDEDVIKDVSDLIIRQSIDELPTVTINLSDGTSNTYTYSDTSKLMNDICTITTAPPVFGGMYADVFKKEVEKCIKKGEKDMEKDPFPGYSYIHSMLEPERIVFNPPATVVFWKDGSKTVVKCSPGEVYSPYYGFLAALAKRIFRTNSEVNRVIRKNTAKDETLEKKIADYNGVRRFCENEKSEKTDLQKACEKASKAIKKYANSMKKEPKKK